MSDVSASEAEERILDAAEWLFAEYGYHGTTLRQITQRADVNLAAVNYYHGDKENLYLAVLRRRLTPINELRAQQLAAAELASDGDPVPLETLLEIMAAPLLELSADPSSQPAARLLGRCLTEPLPFTTAFLEAEFQPALTRFGQALRRHAPTMPPEEFLWRLAFVVGALQHMLTTLHRMAELTRGICRDHDHTAALRHFVEIARRAFQGDNKQQAG